MNDNEKSIYRIDCSEFVIECFRVLDVEPESDFAYKVSVVNKLTGESDFVTTNTPQAAIALANEVRDSI